MSVHINDPDFFKFVEQATSDSRVSFIHIMPVLIRIFPVCLAYADGLLFVGMLNAANPPLNETVVYLFYYITLCRILQCVSAYLMFDVFEEGSGSDQAHQTTPFAATTLASVFAFVLAAYNFSSCVVYSAALNYIGVLGPIYSLQLSFIILMSCLELSKFILSCALFFSDDNIMETVFKQTESFGISRINIFDIHINSASSVMTWALQRDIFPRRHPTLSFCLLDWQRFR